MMTNVMFGIYQIFKKPGVFLITVVMMAISLIVSFYSFLVYDSYHYPVKQIKENLSCDIEDVYKINFGLAMIGLHSDDLDKIKNLINAMDEMPELSVWGGYYYGTQDTEKKLYINEELYALCGIKDSEDMPLSYDYDEIAGDYGIAFVGQELSEKYPKGSIFYDDETGCQYIVQGYVKEKSKWLSDDLYDGMLTDLDNAVILDWNYALDRTDDDFFIINICDNLFFAVQDKNVKENVKQLIENSELDIDGVFCMETLCSSYEREAMDNAGENYLFPLVLLISAVIVSVVTSKMSLLTNKKDYGIMITNGFTRMDITTMVITENVIKVLTAYLICMIYWMIQYINMDTVTKNLYEDMWLFKIIIVIGIIVLSCENPVRYLLKIKPIELINKKEL